MAQVKYNKTIFSNGMMGKSTFGRTDSDYYKGAVKRIVDGIIFPQGGIKNITLDEDSIIPMRHYERVFEIKKGKFAGQITGAKYMIGQRSFSDTIDLMRVNITGQEVTGVSYIDTLNFGADLREYLVQIDDKIIVNTSGNSATRNETYFSGILQKYGDSDVVNDVIEDSVTFDIEVQSDKTLTGFNVSGYIGAGLVTLINTVNNGGGSYTLTVRADECQARNLKVQDAQVTVPFNVGDTIPTTYEEVREIDGEIWVGILNKVDEAETIDEPILIEEDSPEEITEETSTYRIFSQAYQRTGLLPDGSKGLLTRYRVYQSFKGEVAIYEGRLQTAECRVATSIQATATNLVTAFTYPIAVLELEVNAGELRFKAGSPKTLSTVMDYSPVNPTFKFIENLLDDLGYGGSRFYAWKYDPINDYYELFISSDSGHTNEITIGGTPITQRPEMEETRLYGGSGRKVSGNNKQYKILGIPAINTYDFTDAEAKVEDIIPESLYCYSILDVDFCGLAGKFDNRLILTQFLEGSSIIAFSRLRDFFDFTFDGTSTNDAYVTEFKDDIDLRIERIIEHKSMVLFTNKGIYASSLLDSQFNPTSFAFSRVHTMVPSTAFPPEFLNSDLIFLDSRGAKLYAMIELKESARYSIVDLTLFANDIFEAGITTTTIDLAQEVGSEYVLISSFTNDALVNYNSDNDILSWTTLSTEGIYTKVFTEGSNVYVYDLFRHGITRTKPKFSRAVIELLEPEIEFGNGDRLSFHEYYKVERAYIKIFGKFNELLINSEDPLDWESQPFSRDDNYVVVFDLNYNDEKDIIITMEAEEELILQGIAVNIDVGE